jgi:hypothetical protein
MNSEPILVNGSPYISESYRAQQQHLHETTNYGTASIKYAHLVTAVLDKLEVTHLLDYGAGHNMNLGKHIKPKQKLTYQAYDPCVPELAGAPVPAQMVACIDVLEHIEPDCLDAVLDHIASLTEAVALLTVHTGPATKVLPDGRNAHIIQEPMEWWLPKLSQRFELQTIQKTHAQAFYVIGFPKAKIEAVSGEKIVS